MVAAGHTGEFFGLILPHGTLELTALFIASGVGLKLGWTVVDPGPRRRTDALAEEGRARRAVAIGLVGVLAVVRRPRGLRHAVTAADVGPHHDRDAGVGRVPGLLVVLGGRAVRAGETGDVSLDLRAQLAPASA